MLVKKQEQEEKDKKELELAKLKAKENLEKAAEPVVVAKVVAVDMVSSSFVLPSGSSSASVTRVN